MRKKHNQNDKINLTDTIPWSLTESSEAKLVWIVLWVKVVRVEVVRVLEAVLPGRDVDHQALRNGVAGARDEVVLGTRPLDRCRQEY